MQSDLDTVIQQKVRALPINLQEDVLEYVEKVAASNARQEGSLEHTVADRLLAHGLLDESPSLLTDDEDSDFELIEIQGDDLSEVIIRERR